MARDAISRQYDVDKNRMTLTCETEKGDYRPGIITFFPKSGKSLDLRQRFLQSANEANAKRCQL